MKCTYDEETTEIDEKYYVFEEVTNSGIYCAFYGKETLKNRTIKV